MQVKCAKWQLQPTHVTGTAQLAIMYAAQDPALMDSDRSLSVIIIIKR